MRYTVITLFPNLVRPWLEESLLKKALERGLIQVEVVDLTVIERRNTVADRTGRVHRPQRAALVGGGEAPRSTDVDGDAVPVEHHRQEIRFASEAPQRFDR